jgi:hypothetical protein
MILTFTLSSYHLEYFISRSFVVQWIKNEVHMNIQIEDKRILDVLNNSVIDTFEFGSKIYGLDTQNSDIDDIAVVKQNDFFANTFLWEHHTIQRASKERDTIYTTLQLLVRNLMTGDSTAYFETLHSNQCKGTILEFLADRKTWFYNFTTIRSFLGYARRDIKHSKDNGKRFAHAVRCYYAAKMLFEDNFYTNDYREYNHAIYNYILAAKLGTHGLSKYEMSQEIQYYKKAIDDLRKEVSNSFNSNQRRYNRYMSVERLREIDAYVIDKNKSLWYDLEDKEFYINQMYHALENGVEYG